MELALSWHQSSSARILRSIVGVWARRALPRTEGTVRVPGLENHVEIIRDCWGVPHIYADSAHDLFMAQGYVHAQERLWQMELQRRVASGRLAELFGLIAVDTDRWVRTLGLRRAAEADMAVLSEESQNALEAYAAGVNNYLAEKRPLPLEFTLLHHRPEPWTPVDSLVWSKVLAWGLSFNWESELIRAHIIAQLGPEKAVQVDPIYPDANPVIVPPGVNYHNLGKGALAVAEKAIYLPKPVLGAGSNNWVIAPQKSSTGAPLLANDPHLKLQVPSLWFENHLSGGGYHVTGASLVGMPGVLIGHNERIAWGITASFADTQDLFIERFHPENRYQYEFQGQWLEAKVVREEIWVKGQAEPVVQEVLITRHGPIITPALYQDDRALALRWVGLDACDQVHSLLMLNRAGNWDEFRAALAHFASPSLNLVYADVDGNIGYALAGWIPVRAQGQGLVPVPGWTGEWEWIGYIPAEEMPQAYNPTQGFLVTANNKIVDDSFPYFLGAEYMNGYRARRITDVLSSKEKVSMADCGALQMDFYSIPGLEMAAFLRELEVDEPDLQQALAYVHDWDGYLTADSVGGAIYVVFQRQLLYNTFADTLGEDYLGRGPHPLLSPGNLYVGRSTPLLLTWLKDAETPWYDHVGQSGRPETRDDVMRLSLRQAVDYLRQHLGPDMDKWQWGRIHQVVWSHVLSAQRPLNLIFDRGPYSIGGDTDTVHQSAFLPHEPYNLNAWGPSYRQVIEVGDWYQSQAMHPPGQSGHVASRHYDDLIELWLKGEYHPMLWERADVEHEAEARLILAVEA
ncbi:MAG TPA: penicillin acylase family protein [Anaerolineae bacterium]|nr:penicillin acylase family protein [Anaerolineae bacterium]